MKILLDADKPNAFNVGNPTPEISMNDLASKVQALLGNNIQIENIKYPATYPEDEPNRRCPDITRITTELNFQPRVSLEEGLKRFFDWSSQNYTNEIL